MVVAFLVIRGDGDILPTGNFESFFNCIRSAKQDTVEVVLYLPQLHNDAREKLGEFPFELYSNRIPTKTNLVHNLLAFRSHLKKTKFSFDVLHAFIPTPAFAWISDYLKWITGKPVITTIESPSYQFKGILKPRFSRELFNYFLRYFLSNRLMGRISLGLSDYYVVASHYQKKELIELGFSKERIVRISNSTDKSRFQHLTPKIPLNSTNPNGKETVGFIGQFNFCKGITVLIKAFKDVVQERPNVKLLLVEPALHEKNSDVEMAIKRNKLESHIEWVRKRVDIPKYLSQMDVLVLPYTQPFGSQMYPNLVLESLVAGVPLIVSDISPVNELVADGETALLVPAGDVQGLSRSIVSLLANPSLREKMIVRQREEAPGKYDYRSASEDYLYLYQKALRATTTVYSNTDIASNYDKRRFGGPGGQYVNNRELNLVDELLPPKGWMLDCPCGTGRLISYLKPSERKVIGMDFSPEMIKIAKERADNKIARAHFFNLALKKETFESVTSIRFSHQIGDIDLWFGSIYLSLKPDGIFIFDTYSWSPRSFVKFFKKGPQVHTLKRAEVRKLLEKNRFKIIKEVNCFLFSPLIYAKLPKGLVYLLDLLEKMVPGNLLVRTFWKVQKS